MPDWARTERFQKWQPVPRGMTRAGNIDLAKQPRVQTPEGVSTVRSIGVNFDGSEVLIPTVAHAGDRVLSNEEAIEQYRKSGKHLGMFRTPGDSDAYARQLHEDYEQGRIAGHPAIGVKELQRKKAR